MKKFDKSAPQLADLQAIVTVIEEGTVTRAAQRLDMTQSALSYHLERMRKRFADPLFVRVGHRMAPTPFAQRLAEPAGRVLRIMDAEIGGLTSFEPARTDREFRIGVNEIGAIALVPRLVAELARRAPLSRLLPVQVRADVMASALEAGDMDVAAGHFAPSDTRLYQQLLYYREYVCVARIDHPQVGRSLSLGEFNRLPQVRTHSAPDTMAWADKNLRGVRSTPGLRMLTQHFAAVPFIVAASDFIAIIPQEIYELFKPIAPIKKVRLPLPIPRIDIHQYWHPRLASDPAIKFFRELVYEVAREGP